MTVTNCATTRHYDFSLKDTVSIFLLNNGKNYYFCIPVQYTGDYQIEKFEFTSGNILVGDYELLLKKDEVNIYVYLNEEAADPFGISSGEFNLVYSEENGDTLISKMNEPLTNKHNSDEIMNHYYIFIEKHLKDDEMKSIINEYERGNVYSNLVIWYDISIDNEEQNGNGMSDDFELYNGPFIDTAQLFPNLDFFRVKYLQ
jgi:hypothetical protein